MVLATKAGKERSFAAGFFLTIVTFGIYAIYWNYRAHNELYRQFELEREGRDEGMVWYVLGLTLQPLLVAYMWIFASNVDYLRRRIGLGQRTTPGKFVAIAGTGVGAFALAIVLLAVATFGLSEDSTEAEIDAALAPYWSVAITLFVGGAILLAIAYWMLQRDINEVWDAFDARLRYLAVHPEEMRSPEMHALVPAPGAPTLAIPLREEVEALRAKHPTLRALEELDPLVLRAEAGEHDAREQAERLLGDVAGLLQERAQLLAIQEEPDASERLEVLDAALFREDDRRGRDAEPGHGGLEGPADADREPRP